MLNLNHISFSVDIVSLVLDGRVFAEGKILY